MRVSARKFTPVPSVGPWQQQGQDSSQEIELSDHSKVEYIDAEIIEEVEAPEESSDLDSGNYADSSASSYVGVRTQYDAFQDLTRVNHKGFFETANRLAKYREPTLQSLEDYKAKILSSAKV